MITITKEQARTRFTLLPPTLQDAVFSVQTAEIISAIGEQYHIPDDKLQTISSLVGWVLLGFLHIEDLPGEIVVSTAVAPQLAKDITDSLTNKIFIAIKPDIEKAYAPVPHEESPEAPTILKNTGPAVATSFTTTPSPTPIKKPTTLSDVGWSRASSAGPGIKLTTLPNTAAQPQTQPPAAIPIPTPPQATHTEPAPIMLHEDTAFKAAEKNTGFTLSKPGSGAEVHMNQSPSQAPARPAVLEFGGIHPSTPPQNKPTTTSSSSATHYTELKLSLSAIPTVNSGPRNINQVTSPLAQPPIPNPSTPSAGSTQNTVPIPRPPEPLASMPPQPPKPPQNDKPIVKDFL